jgi:hypothetical protein
VLIGEFYSRKTDAISQKPNPEVGRTVIACLVFEFSWLELPQIDVFHPFSLAEAAHPSRFSEGGTTDESYLGSAGCPILAFFARVGGDAACAI